MLLLPSILATTLSGSSIRFVGLGEDEPAGFEDDRVRRRLLDPRTDTLFLVGVDHLVARDVPDKVVPEPDIEGVRLYQGRVEGIDPDEPSFDVVLNLPVNKNH